MLLVLKIQTQWKPLLIRVNFVYRAEGLCSMFRLRDLPEALENSRGQKIVVEGVLGVDW